MTLQSAILFIMQFIPHILRFGRKMWLPDAAAVNLGKKLIELCAATILAGEARFLKR